MNRFSAFGALFLALTFIASAATSEPVTLGDTETLVSKVLGEERHLMVYLPDGYATSEASYPVLYLLDAGTRFHHTTGTVASLSRSGHIPEMIVVAVRNTDRTRDLTPAWMGPQPSDEISGRAATAQAGGGADNFLRFLKDELIPHVEAKYRTVPYRILVGHSFGGLFAAHALVREPELFDAILAISPSLWWDEGATVEQARTLFRERPDLTGRFYMILADEGGDMLTQFRNMETLLRYRAPAGLRWHSSVVDGEDHGSIPSLAVHSGLKAIFPLWQLPAFAREEGLPALDQHFAALSKEYGYPIVTPEALINNLGYQALGAGEVDKAVEIFRANVERYPGSANVYDSLGEGLEAAGHLEQARQSYLRAYETGEGDPNREVYKTHLDAVTETLGSGK